MERGSRRAREDARLITHGLWPTVRSKYFSVVRWEDVASFGAENVMINFNFEMAVGVGYRLKCVYRSRGKQKQEINGESARSNPRVGGNLARVVAVGIIRN